MRSSLWTTGAVLLFVLSAVLISGASSNSDADQSRDGVFTPWFIDGETDSSNDNKNEIDWETVASGDNEETDLDDDRLYLDNVQAARVPFWVQDRQSEFQRIQQYKSSAQRKLEAAQRVGKSLARLISHTATSADKKMRQFRAQLDAVPLTTDNAAEFQKLAADAEAATGSIVRLGEQASIVGLGNSDPQNTWNIFEQINDEVNNQARRQIFNAGVGYLQTYGKPAKRYPVVLIPGFGGTRLVARQASNKYGNPCNLGAEKYRSIWLSSRRLFRFMTEPGMQNCFYDALSLVWNGKDFVQPPKFRVRRVKGSHGVDLLDPGIASSLSEYYNPLIKAFESLGYRRDYDVRAWGYDWRFRPDQPRMRKAFNRLKKEIEELYELEKQPVVVIAHSMGAQHFIYFLDQLVGKDATLGRSWVDKYVRSFVSIGGNHGGSPRVLRALISGTRFSQPFFNKRKTGNMFASFGSSAFMLPTADVWSTRPLLIIRGRSGATRGYSALRMERLLERGFSNPTVFHYKQTAPYTVTPGQLVADTHVLYGYNVPTPISYVYERKYDSKGVVKGLRLIATERGTGDGFVPRRSARVLCKTWKDIRCHGFEKVNHRELLWHLPLLTQVLEVATGLRTASQGLVKPLVNPLNTADADKNQVAAPGGDRAMDLGVPTDVDGIEPVYSSTPEQDASAQGVPLFPSA